MVYLLWVIINSTGKIFSLKKMVKLLIITIIRKGFYRLKLFQKEKKEKTNWLFSQRKKHADIEEGFTCNQEHNTGCSHYKKC